MTNEMAIVLGVIAVALIAGFLYLKHKNPAELTTIETAVSAEVKKVTADIVAEFDKLKADLSKAPPPSPGGSGGGAGSSRPIIVNVPPAPPAGVPTATPAGAVPTKEQVAALETATTQFHAAHAALAQAAKTVAGS